jgi:hypothetical protein
MRESSISDQKRLVRALHWKEARRILRVRDKDHHRPWRLLTIAGPAPHEEITCIREHMHKAHITSVDIEPANLELAIEAGADEVVHCDVENLTEYVREDDTPYQPSRPAPPKEFINQEFDVVCLDLSGPADDDLKHVVKAFYHGCVVKEGVLIVTFCMGRDVVEVFQDEWERTKAKSKFSKPAIFAYLEKSEIPETVAMRVWYLLRGQLTNQLASCLKYKGGEMPMVSCLLCKGHAPPGIKFESLGGRDYELAANDIDFGKACACPADYLQDLRARSKRSEAAFKAVETRRRLNGGHKQPPQLRVITNDEIIPPQPRVTQMVNIWDECSGDERATFWRLLHAKYVNANSSDPDVAARSALLQDIRDGINKSSETPQINDHGMRLVSKQNGDRVAVSVPKHDATCLCLSCCLKRKKQKEQERFNPVNPGAA